ncbi:peptidase M56 [Sphingomonas suaedae]|uniref:Peptidase M56 n=1 Tax=Sphingomonas suaedae TaxID=2599297 RepID=A0A518RBV3_9SPHN|nr:M56 family metallopeptidase [Sphingomonas suaedae]QDX24946.1 peptidase M56 [Sphingomonas suaedae]
MIAWIIETVIATTLLMLLVLALRKQVGRTFGPNIAYALWVLPVLRMVMPPMPGTWSFTDWLAALTQSAETGPGVTFGVLNADRAPQAIIDNALIQAQVELAGRQADIAIVPPTVVEGGPNIATLLIGIWVIGALVFLGYHLIAHRRFCASLLRKAEARRTVAEGRVHVIETDAATGPLAFGIWRKYVAFPRDFAERYDPLERNLALAHELGHHVRGDLIANWIALVVLALHWFNPVAWRAFRAFRADQEMACDALVLSGRAPALRHAYGRAIVKSAHGGAVSAACHLHTVNELKGRLKMLSKHNPKSRTRITAGVTGALALSLGALALTASGTGAAASLPEAPVAPTAPRPPLPPQADATIAPDAPEPPLAAEAPEAPGAPEAPEVPKAKREYRYVFVDDGKKGDKRARTETKVVIKGDGSNFTWSGDTKIDVKAIKCGGSKDDEVKVETRDGDKRKIVICTDRIEMRAAAAADKAKDVEAIARRAETVAIASARMGTRHALMGLKMARKSVEMQDELSAEQKSAALKGIDDAIREIETADID